MPKLVLNVAIATYKNKYIVIYHFVNKISEICHFLTDNDCMIEMSGIDLVNRIDDLLKKMGKNRPEMAEEIGFSVSNIAHWKRRNSLPDAQTIYSMSKYLKVSVDYLLTGNNGTDLSMETYLIAKKIELLSDEGKAAVECLTRHYYEEESKKLNQ